MEVSLHSRGPNASSRGAEDGDDATAATMIIAKGKDENVYKADITRAPDSQVARRPRPRSPLFP